MKERLIYLAGHIEVCPNNAHTLNQTLLRYLFGVCLWGALHPTKLSLPL